MTCSPLISFHFFNNFFYFLSQTSIKDFAQSIVTGRTTTVPMSMRPVISSECSPSMDLGPGQEESAESSEGKIEKIKIRIEINASNLHLINIFFGSHSITLRLH